jgi:hypothetical protein
MKRKKTILIGCLILTLVIIKISYKDEKKTPRENKSISELSPKEKALWKTSRSKTKSDVNKKNSFESSSKKPKASFSSDEQLKEDLLILNSKYKEQLEEKIQSYLVNPDKLKEWQAGRSSFEALLGNIMNDTKSLESSLETNLTILQQNLKLNDHEKNQIQSEYRTFYIKTMELYQSSFDGISVDYLSMISTSDKFYQSEDLLIFKTLGIKALKKFQTKELERRANFYALLKYYSTHKIPNSNI